MLLSMIGSWRRKTERRKNIKRKEASNDFELLRKIIMSTACRWKKNIYNFLEFGTMNFKRILKRKKIH